MAPPLRLRQSPPPFTLVDLSVIIVISDHWIDKKKKERLEDIVPSEEPVAEEVALIEGIPLDMSFQRRWKDPDCLAFTRSHCFNSGSTG